MPAGHGGLKTTLEETTSQSRRMTEELDGSTANLFHVGNFDSGATHFKSSTGLIRECNVPARSRHQDPGSVSVAAGRRCSWRNHTASLDRGSQYWSDTTGNLPGPAFPEFRHALVRGGALCLITVETGGNHRLDAAVIQNAKGDAYMPFKLPGNRINNVAYPFQVFS